MRGSVANGVVRLPQGCGRKLGGSHPLGPWVSVYVVFAVGPARPPVLTYPARGVGNLWGKDGPVLAGEDPLSALLGRRRAEILRALDLPSCTTDLAARLGQSPSAVSQHLSVLRRNGLV